MFDRLRKAILGESPGASRPAPRPRPREAPAGDGPSPAEHHELVLYKYDACPFCRSVLRVVDETGLPVATRDTRMDPSARDELRRATGGTQVPCLFIDGVPMLESADINRWLRQYAADGGAAAQEVGATTSARLR